MLGIITLSDVLRYLVGNVSIGEAHHDPLVLSEAPAIPNTTQSALALDASPVVEERTPGEEPPTKSAPAVVTADLSQEGEAKVSVEEE